MSKKRGPYSSPRQQDRRERILRAAVSELEKHGVNALTMDSIAKVSDVSTKTLYNLFDSRELLLLEAASGRLINLEHSESVQSVEQGMERLLAFRVGALKQLMEMPEYGRELISILVQLDRDNEAANARFGPIQRFAYQSLSAAGERGELHAGLDLMEIAYLFAANHWGLILLWEKGLLSLDRLETQVRLNHYLTLAPLCLAKQKKLMEGELNALIDSLTSTAGQ